MAVAVSSLRSNFCLRFPQVTTCGYVLFAAIAALLLGGWRRLANFTTSGDWSIRTYQYCKLQLADVRWLVWLWKGWTYWLGSAMFQPEPRQRPKAECQRCGGELELMLITNQVGATIWQRRPASGLQPAANSQPVRGPP